MKNSTTGFTIIELLVVISIIVFLATIIVTSVNHARRRAYDVKQVSVAKEMHDGLEKFNIAYGEYPNGNNIFSTYLVATITSASGAKAEMFLDALASYIPDIRSKLPLTVYPEIKWEYCSAPQPQLDQDRSIVQVALGVDIFLRYI